MVVLTKYLHKGIIKVLGSKVLRVPAFTHKDPAITRDQEFTVRELEAIIKDLQHTTKVLAPTTKDQGLMVLQDQEASQKIQIRDKVSSTDHGQPQKLSTPTSLMPVQLLSEDLPALLL